MTTSRSTATTSPIAPGSLSVADLGLSSREADDYSVVRIRNAAFNAVHSLWRRRQSEGLNQQKLAESLGRDKAWVSRALSGPANWEFKTFARLIRALGGEAEITVHPLEDPTPNDNYDVYRDNDFVCRVTVSTSTAGLVAKPSEFGKLSVFVRETA